jgi:hypothetical protein
VPLLFFHDALKRWCFGLIELLGIVWDFATRNHDLISLNDQATQRSFSVLIVDNDFRSVGGA